MLIFTRLSKAWRILAGRLLALLYLLCVLAPGSAFAFGNARFADHCLFDDGAFAAVFHTHGASSIAHESGHKHASAPTDAMHHHDEQSDFAAESSTPSPRGDRSAMDLQCCGMLCIAALTASLEEVATPCPTNDFALPDRGQHAAAGLPSRHYRPPIWLNILA